MWKQYVSSVSALVSLIAIEASASTGIRMIGNPVFYPYSSAIISISDDGTISVGRYSTSNTSGSTYFKYSALHGYEEYLTIPDFSSYTVRDLSGDGSTTVGTAVMVDAQGSQLIRGYRVDNGSRTIIPPPTGYSEVYIQSVSRNGQFVAGVVPVGETGYWRAVRWSAERGTELLPSNQTRQDIVDIYEVSDQGDIISVTGRMSGFRYATRYNYADRSMHILQPLDTSFWPDSEGQVMTRNGDYVYGTSEDGPFEALVRWDRQGNITNLGKLPSRPYVAVYGGSDDGSIIVGSAAGGGSIPFVYSASEGWFTIAEYLQHHNVAIPNGWSIDLLSSVSGDGRTLGGLISHPTLGRVAFTATVPAPALPVIIGLAGLLATRRRRQ